jgi:two-component system chemotaxis response regulator CheY
MRILIVEDDLTSRLLLKKMLEAFGSCDVAVNGKEAVEACRLAQASGETYALVCLDIMMPEMDGQAALKAIRAQEEAAACPPSRAAKIVMTTALRDIENVTAAYRELCDGYLVKPIARDKLVGLLKDLDVISLQADHLTS